MRTNNTTPTLAPTSPLKSVLLFPTEPPYTVQKHRSFTEEEDRASKAGLAQPGLLSSKTRTEPPFNGF
ncbi:hypothetical protein BT96DRAFT_919959, partial [Gymnopus androsaceus JB14]